MHFQINTEMGSKKKKKNSYERTHENYLTIKKYFHAKMASNFCRIIMHCKKRGKRKRFWNETKTNFSACQNIFDEEIWPQQTHFLISLDFRVIIFLLLHIILIKHIIYRIDENDLISVVICQDSASSCLLINWG